MKELYEDALNGHVPSVIYVAKYGPHDHRVGIVGDYRKNVDAALTAIHIFERRVQQWENSFSGFI